MRTQFNVRVSQATKKKVQNDRKNSGATNDVITEVALENFFTQYSPEQRTGFYRNHGYKPYGRK